MDKKNSLTDEDQNTYVFIVNSLLFCNYVDKKSIEDDHEIKFLQNEPRDKNSLSKDSDIVKNANEFIIKFNDEYNVTIADDIQFKNESYIPKIIPTDEEEINTTSAPVSYSYIKYLLHYYTDVKKSELEKNYLFFRKQLKIAQRGLKTNHESKNWQEWFDWFWILSKNTAWVIHNLQEYIELQNLYWTCRVKFFIEKSNNKSNLFLHSKVFPFNFNNEIENILTTSFGSDNAIYGNSPLLFKCFLDALNIANDNEPCLIIGETGTGKESIAKLIHTASRRRNSKFIAVNCAGITDSLFNSEISGIKKGAATGVDASLGACLSASGYTLGKDGPIQPPSDKSEGGTLFLDEINSLDIHHQAKLLRIIQEKEVQVVGGNLTYTLYIKFVCATNKEIQKDFLSGNFREDLYYRIGKGIIRVPSLREMPDAIDDISQGTINKIKESHQYCDKVMISKKALEKLKEYSWPGNIRELENVLYRAFKQMRMDNKYRILPDHIEFPKKAVEIKETNLFENLSYKEAIAKFEKDYLEMVFKKVGWKKMAAHKYTGLSRATIDKKIKDLGIDANSLQD